MGERVGGGEMSRSYKRVAVVKDRNRGQKTVANRRVRRQAGLFQGGEYKRLYETWNICDFQFSCDNYALTKDLRGFSWEEKKQYVSK